jgi:hypothetical protein
LNSVSLIVSLMAATATLRWFVVRHRLSTPDSTAPSLLFWMTSWVSALTSFGILAGSDSLDHWLE